MPPKLGQLFPVDFPGRPPHMAGRDLGLWAVWRQRLPFPYQGFYFDAALGTPPEADPAARAEVNRAWEFLLARRIDAVGVLPERFDIIEIRRGADQAAIGALLMYRHLWTQDPPDDRPVNMILVTDRADVDTKTLAAANGIQLEELGP